MKKLAMAAIVAAFAISAAPVYAADFPAPAPAPVDTHHGCPLLWPFHVIGHILHIN